MVWILKSTSFQFLFKMATPTRCAPSLSSLPKVALETVPIFICLNRSFSILEGGTSAAIFLHSSFLQAICAVLCCSSLCSERSSVLCCSSLSMFREILSAVLHWSVYVQRDPQCCDALVYVQRDPQCCDALTCLCSERSSVLCCSDLSMFREILSVVLL